VTRTPFMGGLVLLLAAFQLVPTGHLRAQMQNTVRHEHLTEVACVDVPTGEKAAEAAKSATGIVVEEDGRAWLSEFDPRNTVLPGGEAIAVVGPLRLLAAKSYTAVLSYAVMRPGDNSRVHTHPGPEGWYVLAGEQCLETPAGAHRSRAGEATTVPPNVPMELNVTGTALRRAFALVIHDSAQQRGIPSEWKPSGACNR
jgi:quercetin dioxygenase-like cupin family protein